ncbi:MAG: glycosyltransferase family 4 protein [Chloroflexaceae bacterium]|jgi:glycosyltransferase involved in cell wall biosynthesis|nr:glycosyltransferase family 4 protein [Chloroflexaceae bacterium]
MRNVLMIAYFYPPIANAGVQRTLKFAKYLPGYGYAPLLLTTGMRGSLPNDGERKVFRADDLVATLYRGLRAWRRPGLAEAPTAQQANTRLIPASSPLARWRERLLLPDTEITWYWPAVRLGLQLVRSQSVQLIYSTSSPETDHMVGLRLKQLTGQPWVADFRDGWMFEPLRAERGKPGLRRWIELDMERRVMLHADRIVTVSEVIADDMRRRFPHAAERVRVITNGYDEEDFIGLRRQRPADGRFRLVHTGSLGMSRAGTSLEGLLVALAQLKAEGHPLLQTIELRMAGRLSENEVATLRRHGLDDISTLTGMLPHGQALQEQMDADLLLLAVAPGATGVLTGKLFEYLAAGRPILTLSGPSAAARLVEEQGAGVVVPPGDGGAIRRALLDYFAQWQSGGLKLRPATSITRFARRALTGRLAAVFDELSDER